jgi:hypothetical protein
LSVSSLTIFCYEKPFFALLLAPLLVVICNYDLFSGAFVMLVCFAYF